MTLPDREEATALIVEVANATGAKNWSDLFVDVIEYEVSRAVGIDERYEVHSFMREGELMELLKAISDRWSE